VSDGLPRDFRVSLQRVVGVLRQQRCNLAVRGAINDGKPSIPTLAVWGRTRANEAAFTSAVNRRRRASRSMAHKETSGSALPNKSSNSSKSSRSASTIRSRT